MSGRCNFARVLAAAAVLLAVVATLFLFLSATPGHAQTTTVPGAPTNLTDVPGHFALELNWTAPDDDGGSPITGYEIKRNTWHHETGNTNTSYVLDNFPWSGIWWIEVRAINANGKGAWSDFWPVEVQFATVTITGPTVVSEGDDTEFFRFTLTADRPVLSASRPLNVNVLVSETEDKNLTTWFEDMGDKVVSFPLGARETTLQVRTLDNNVYNNDNDVTATIQTSTDYTVGAPASATVTIVDDDPVPAPPTGLTATLIHFDFNLSWTAPPDAELSPILYYRLKVNGELDSDYHYSTTANDINHRDRFIGDYTVRVRAVNLAGVSDWSDPIRISTRRATITIASNDSVREGEDTVFTLTSDLPNQLSINGKSALVVDVLVSESNDMVASTNEKVHTVWIDFGATTATLTIPTVDNNIVNPDSVVTATIQPRTGQYPHTVGTPASAEVRVENDDVFMEEPRPSCGVSAPHSSGHSIKCIQLMGSNYVQTPEGMAALGYKPIGIKQLEIGDIIAMEGLPDDWVINVLGEKVDDAVVTIAAGTSPVTEGTEVMFTVTRATATTTHLSVTVGVAETQRMIFSGVPDSIRSVRWPIRVDILANATDATFMVLTDDDDVDETDSVITATVLAKNGYTVGTSGQASVTVEDNDGTAQQQQQQTRETPDAPKVFIATTNGPAQVDLIWTTPKSGTATGYDIQWSADGETGWQAVEPLDDGADTMYRHTGLTSGTTYHYRMRYLTEDGPGEWTHPTAATTARLNSFATGVPTISGTAQVGERLTADASGIADEDGLENVSFSYQWMADGTDIGGATGSVYALAEADEGKVIKVRVSFTDDVGNDEELTSVATDAVGAAPRSPLTASLENTPVSHDGETAFTFDLRLSEGLSVSYRTLRDHVFTVSGGMVKNASRLEQSSNMGWRIEVRPNANDEVTVVLPVTGDCADAGAICAEDGRKLSSRLELTVSGPESQQQAVQNSPATGQPAISGTAQVGETLTADTTGISDEDGLNNVTYTYQWTAGGSDIDGATGSSITLTASQQGQTVQVRVSFIDDAEHSETLTSVSTAAVAAKPADPLTASFSNIPDTHNGTTFTFDLTFSENVKAGYERIRDDAFNASGGDIIKAQRREQGTNQYWTITVKPDGNGGVGITLPATTDCDATGAICTYDDRALSHSTAVTVTGPG